MATPIKMFKTTEKKANSISVQDGQLIFTTDTNKIYLDSDGKRECYIHDNIKTYVSKEQPGAAKNGDVWLVIENESNVDEATDSKGNHVD